MSKILVIDDDDAVVKLLTTVLESSDFDVVGAGDGLQATVLAHDHQPDLIVLDLILPVGGGVTALRNLRMSKHTKKIPVIVISGSGDEKLKEEVTNLGIEHFYHKPLDPNELVSKIREILSEKA